MNDMDIYSGLNLGCFTFQMAFGCVRAIINRKSAIIFDADKPTIKVRLIDIKSKWRSFFISKDLNLTGITSNKRAVFVNMSSAKITSQ